MNFRKAAHIPARGASASGDFVRHQATENAKTLGKPRVLQAKVGDTGFDSPGDFTGNSAEPHQSAVKSAAVVSGSDLLAVDDGGNFDDHSAGVAAIVEAWPTLSPDARRAMVEFVERQLGKLTVATDARPAGSN